MKLTKIFFIIFCGLTNISYTSLVAQSIEKSVISTSGKVYYQSGVELQWTVGEMNISQLSNNDLQLDEGFHSDLRSTDLTTSIDVLKDAKIITISPNPAFDFVRLPQNIKLTEGSRVELYSNNGIFRNELTSKDTHRIDLSSVPKGMYYLVIIQADKTGSIAKIIKT